MGPMLVRGAAYCSLAFASLAVLGALAASAQWSSGGPGPGFVVSVFACVAGFSLATLAETTGTDRRDLRVGLAGLLTNLMVGAFWALIVVAAYAGS